MGWLLQHGNGKDEWGRRVWSAAAFNSCLTLPHCAVQVAPRI